MSIIEITNRDAVYILQALRQWIATESEQFEQFDVAVCTEAELDEFTNHQILLNDFLVIQGELFKKYTDNFDKGSNLIAPAELDLTPETVTKLQKFFPPLSQTNNT